MKWHQETLENCLGGKNHHPYCIKENVISIGLLNARRDSWKNYMHECAKKGLWYPLSKAAGVWYVLNKLDNEKNTLPKYVVIVDDTAEVIASFQAAIKTPPENGIRLVPKGDETIIGPEHALGVDLSYFA